MSCSIRPWVPSDRDAVIELVVAIQQGEFGLDIDADRQPDLSDIERWYRRDGGEFWVATDADTVVGTVAVRVFDTGHGTVRKMFVAPSHRGASGLANDLIEHLAEWCRDHGIDRLTLGTTSVMTTAQRFYTRHGFTTIERADLPVKFPLMEVDSVFFTRAVGVGSDKLKTTNAPPE